MRSRNKKTKGDVLYIFTSELKEIETDGETKMKILQKKNNANKITTLFSMF